MRTRRKREWMGTYLNDLRWSSCALSFVENVQVTVRDRDTSLSAAVHAFPIYRRSSADHLGWHLLLCGRVPWACAISGTAYLSGAIPNKPLPNTGYSQSLTVPSAPEVINDLLSGPYTAVNYVHHHCQDGGSVLGWDAQRCLYGAVWLLQPLEECLRIGPNADENVAADGISDILNEFWIIYLNGTPGTHENFRQAHLMHLG